MANKKLTELNSLSNFDLNVLIYIVSGTTSYKTTLGNLLSGFGLTDTISYNNVALINVKNRNLYDNVGQTSVDWNNKILSGNWVSNNNSPIRGHLIGTGSPLGRIVGNSGDLFWDYSLKGLWIKESGNNNATGWYNIVQTF